MKTEFPKIIHFIWFQGFDDITFPNGSREIVSMWGKMNPNWKIMLWDEKILSNFIQSNFPSYYGCWKNLDKVIKKCDFARWLILHYFGGVYVDCDAIPSKPMNEFLDDKYIYYKDLLDKRSPTSFYKNKEFFPKEKHKTKINFYDYNLILPMEWICLEIENKQIPMKTNCFMVGKPKNPMYLDFLKSGVDFMNSSVLESFGTRRLCRFFNDEGEKYTKDSLFLPPMYAIWNSEWADWSFDRSVNVIKHEYFITWGDNSIDKPWTI